MHSEKRTVLLTSYQQLPTEQQVLLNFLAIYYGESTLAMACKCLFYLGIKNDEGKLLKPDQLKPHCNELLQAELIEQNPKQANYRCNVLLVEPITRKLVADGVFENYADIIERYAPIATLNYYPYNQVDTCLRDMHIQFHRRNYAKVKECYSLGRRNLPLPDYVDTCLAWILNPFDANWLIQQHSAFIGEIAGDIALHQALYLYQNEDIFNFLQQCVTQKLPNVLFLDDSALLVRIFAELQWLRGDWENVIQRLAGSNEPELQAIIAALSFLQGNIDNAISQFEAALNQFRKNTRKRNDYFYGMAGIFYPLAMLKSNDSSQHTKVATILNQASKIGGYWADIYDQIALFQKFLQGDLSQRDTLLAVDIPKVISSGFSPTGKPDSISRNPLIQRFFSLLLKAWIDEDSIKASVKNTQSLLQYVTDNGYHWVAKELTHLLVDFQAVKRSALNNTTQLPAPLAGLFVSRPDWDLALEALANLNKSTKKTNESEPAAEKLTRLIWLVDYQERLNSITLEPREQKQQAKGGWSKGRAVALKRLHSERDSFDYLTEHDVKLCKTIKEYRDNSWYGSTYFEFSAKMPLALIGHPLLFLAKSPEVRVDVIRGDVQLRVKKAKNDKIHISLEPMPAYEQSVHISKETLTRLKIVEFTSAHHKVAALLGSKGVLEVPSIAQERVLQTLTSISGLLTVHSDIGGSSSSAEQVAADATPRLHLLPLGAGLRVAMFIRPFATTGAYYRPGQGGKSVLAELDGKHVQAQRDLSSEKSRSKALVHACPQLQQAECDASGDWLLENPSDCLELLLQLQELPTGQVILEWPEGVKFSVLGQSTGDNFRLSIKRDNDWFALQGELNINENAVIEIQQLLSLLNTSEGRFIQLQDGQFLALTETFRRRLQDLKAYADITGKKVRINPLAALTLEDWNEEVGHLKADKHWKEHLERLKSAQNYQPILPSTFQAELRDYQLDGFVWLSRLAKWGVGACLADDMGLGKTVQGLALLVDQAPNGPSLIVAPTSVCMNWESESRRFAPTLNPIILGTGDRQRVLDNLAPFDLLICSYGLLQQEQVAEMLAKIRFQTVILDEAQAIKNTATRRSQGAMNLQGDFRVIMTGTPLENHLGELWNLYRFINPGLLGSLDQFNQRFAAPIERDQNNQAKQQLKKLIQPFILRRTKTQVLQELPPRTEIPVYVELSTEEMAFYEALRRESLDILSNTENHAGQKHLQILAAITKLRRSCCNSRLVNAEISLPSSKLTAFADIVDELLDNKHKALVFSQFVDHLQLIKDHIEQCGIRYQYLDGSTPTKERQKRVDAFQRGDGELFLISLKAGGVGINLTAADYVIHMDPWWNPAVEDQASDRAHRMGQQRPVTIYRMIAKHTIEEKIVALHSHKRDLADSLLDGTDISGKMSADDLLELMRN